MCRHRFSSLANFFLHMEQEKEGGVIVQLSISFEIFALRSLDLDDVVVVLEVVDKDEVAAVVMVEVEEIEDEGAEVELGPEESKLRQLQAPRHLQAETRGFRRHWTICTCRVDVAKTFPQ